MDEQMLDRLRRGPWNSPDLNDVFAQADSIATVPSGIADDLGFSPAVSRQFRNLVRNGDFAAQPPDTSSNISDITNKLPEWSFVTVAGSSITAKAVADSSASSGYVIRFTCAAGNANDEVYLEQTFPIDSSRKSAFAVWLNAYFLAASSATASLRTRISGQYLKADGTTTGTASTVTTSFAAAVSEPTSTPGDFGSVPGDAAQLRVRVGIHRNVTDATTATIDLCDIFTNSGGDAALIPDDTTASNGPAAITKRSGILYVSPEYAAVVGGSMAHDSTLETAYHIGYPYGAKAIRTGVQSINDATNTSIDFDGTDELDIDSLHNPASNNEKITLSKGGWYLVTGGAAFASNATGNRTVYIELNGKDGGGTLLYPFTRFRASTGDPTGAGVTVVRYFTAGDTIALTVKQDSGGALNVSDARLAAILLSADN